MLSPKLYWKKKLIKSKRKKGKRKEEKGERNEEESLKGGEKCQAQERVAKKGSKTEKKLIRKKIKNVDKKGAIQQIELQVQEVSNKE